MRDGDGKRLIKNGSFVVAAQKRSGDCAVLLWGKDKDVSGCSYHDNENEEKNEIIEVYYNK